MLNSPAPTESSSGQRHECQDAVSIRISALTDPADVGLFEAAIAAPLDASLERYFERLAAIVVPSEGRMGAMPVWRAARIAIMDDVATVLGRIHCRRNAGIDIRSYRIDGESAYRIEFGDKSVTFRIANDRVERTLKFLPAIEPALLARILRLRDDDVMLDVGANIGIYSVMAAACGARCVSVEPFPVNIVELRHNIEANGLEDRIKLVEKAVGKAAETGRMAYSRDIAGIGAQNIQYSERFSTGKKRPEIRVEIETVDNLVERGEIPSPTFVKIDVDGDEANVFAGMEELMRSAPPRLIMVETTPGKPTAFKLQFDLEFAGFKHVPGDHEKNMYFELKPEG